VVNAWPPQRFTQRDRLAAGRQLGPDSRSRRLPAELAKQFDNSLLVAARKSHNGAQCGW